MLGVGCWVATLDSRPSTLDSRPSVSSHPTRLTLMTGRPLATACPRCTVVHAILEPVIATRTLAEFIAGTNTKTVAYLVTAEISAFKTGDTKDEYGNMTLTDGTNTLTIYGASQHTSALTWNELTGEYSFSNPKSFNNETSWPRSVRRYIPEAVCHGCRRGFLLGRGCHPSVRADGSYI